MGIYFCRDDHFSVQYPMEAADLLQRNENSQHSNIQKAIQCVGIYLSIHKTLTKFDLLQTTEPKMQANISLYILVTNILTNYHLNPLKLSYHISIVQWTHRADAGGWKFTPFTPFLPYRTLKGSNSVHVLEIPWLESQSISMSEIVHSRMEGQLT